MTLFSIYRIIKVPGILRLETITDNITVPLSQVENIGLALGRIAHDYSKSFPPLDKEADLLFLEKASPTHATSWTGFW